MRNRRARATRLRTSRGLNQWVTICSLNEFYALSSRVDSHISPGRPVVANADIGPPPLFTSDSRVPTRFRNSLTSGFAIPLRCYPQVCRGSLSGPTQNCVMCVTQGWRAANRRHAGFSRDFPIGRPWVHRAAPPQPYAEPYSAAARLDNPESLALRQLETEVLRLLAHRVRVRRQ